MALDEKLFDIEALAAYLGLPVQTLYRWRSSRPQKGPKGIRVGRYVRWRPSEVDQWLASLEQLPEPPPSRKPPKKRVPRPPKPPARRGRPPKAAKTSEAA